MFFLCIIRVINLVKPLGFFKTEGGGYSGESRIPSAEGARLKFFKLNLSGKRTEQTNL